MYVARHSRASRPTPAPIPFVRLVQRGRALIVAIVATRSQCTLPIHWLCHVLKQHSLQNAPDWYSQLAHWHQFGRGSDSPAPAHKTAADMSFSSSTSSTESLLNSFPMFGHPGISALEYAGSLDAAHKRNTNETLGSLNRKSMFSTQDENGTPPTTAGLDPTGSELGPSPPLHYIDEFGSQQRRRGTFLNHTPRIFEMPSPKNVEVYQPSRSSSSENYSRPRTSSYQATSSDGRQTQASRHGNCSSPESLLVDKRITINRGAPAELDATEAGHCTTLDVYRQAANSHRRSSSVPLTKIVTCQSRSSIMSGPQGREMNIRSTSNPFIYPLEKKRQRRQTPFKITSPDPINTARHAPLEPWVAEHRRKVTNESAIELLPPLKTGEDEEMGTFGVIQRYFDSQTGGPVSSPKILCNACLAYPSDIPPVPSNSVLRSPFREPAAMFPIDELHFSNEPPPAVPDRSPKRLTNPCFPLHVHVESTVSVDSEFAFAAEGQYSPYDPESSGLHVPKKRTPKRLDVGQADLAGSAVVGKEAPPILDHDALTARFHRGCNDQTYYRLGLNDFHYYLRNTGPSPEPRPTNRQRKKTGMRLFKVKQRKSLAARVGSVEGSPQRLPKHAPIPACAREMTTVGGAKHLRIVIPTEAMLSNSSLVRPSSQSKTKRRSRHISIMGDFPEEMLNPLASPAVERFISDSTVPQRSASASEAVSKSPRSPKRTPKSQTPIPVDSHPLASREEQTRARKLRDLQRVKRKPVPSQEQTEQHPDVVAGAPLTPAQTPEPVCESTVESAHEDDGCVEADSPDSKIVRIQERVVSLQRQNTELTEALAKIVGLELEEGELKSEDVLKAFNKIRFFRTPGTE
ncbi:hypothetical protein T440DRAFT_395624 [Plenodomus tracheiphilus IPT5]|uniref:Uncharacterized protein n=1 Tax=Plenodomus tracheiphilus IPT5 TaxID=1408161 RepID=A0A6A7BA09_9PLEO|nr:hypothetical protein T440DRAFT_395624 [Plenodomus tracheiphilus IPT5]